jgi:hypothetical protein
MPLWACGHHRKTVSRHLSGASDELLRAWAAEHPNAPGRWGEQVATEIRRRRSRCPACAAQYRRVRRAWALVIAAALVVLLVGWRIHG